LGSEVLFSSFWSLKEYLILICIKFQINKYITRLFRFWSSNSVFGLWGLIFAFFAPNNVFLLHLYKIPDRWIYLATILILGPKIHVCASSFWPQKVYFFLLRIKLPIDRFITQQYRFRSTCSVFRLWRPTFDFSTPNLFNLHLHKIYDRWIWICHTTILILGLKFRFWAFRAYFSPLKVYIFFICLKFLIDGYTRPY
jgi:hypothetical protein